MAHEGTLYLIDDFRSRAALEPTIHQPRVSIRVNLESLQSRLSGVSLKF